MALIRQFFETPCTYFMLCYNVMRSTRQHEFDFVVLVVIIKNKFETNNTI